MTNRDDFEAWVKSKGCSVKRRDGRYIESMTRLWEDCWQAATARRDAAVAEAVERERGRIKSELKDKGFETLGDLLQIIRQPEGE